ncbi:MAG: cobalt-precorrin-7 (C(5))-methyltransferase [Dehalogenimonas sp.]
MLSIKNQTNKGKVFIVGIGAGGGPFVNEKVENIIDQCEIIVGWPEILSCLGQIVKNKIILEQNCGNYQEKLVEAARIASDTQNDIAVLILDDPTTYSGKNFLLECFSDLDVEFVPAVSTLQLISAAARVSLEDAQLIVFEPTAIGALGTWELKRKRSRMLSAYSNGYHLIVLSDLEQTLTQTASFLIDKDLPRNAAVVIGEDMGSPNERVSSTTLLDVTRNSYSWSSAMVVKNQICAR